MNETRLSLIRKEAYEAGYVDGKVEGYNLIDTQIDLDEIAETHELIGYDRGFKDGYAQAMEEAVRAVGRDTWAGSRLLKLQPAKFNERSEDGTN